MSMVSGRCDERFAAVREAFEANFAEGREIGASVAVAVRGEIVVDLWGGHADVDRSRPWQRDTIVNTWSTTKTMTALCALLLADQGELDLYAPVARYWPEFGIAGKGGIEVRHLLAHTSGLSGWQVPISMRDLADWEMMTSLLAAQEPWWSPGTASAYHAMTQGFLIGEVIRRVTGQSLGSFFAEHIARPLGADFHIGLDPLHHARVAEAVDEMRASAVDADRASIAFRTMSNPVLQLDEVNSAWWRQAEIPAVNGHGNARSVALVQSLLTLDTEIQGWPQLSRGGRELALRVQSDGVDGVIGGHVRFGMGYALRSGGLPLEVCDRTCFWGGRGGSLVVVNMRSGVVLAYVMNRIRPAIVGDERGLSLLAATQSVSDASPSR